VDSIRNISIVSIYLRSPYWNCPALPASVSKYTDHFHLYFNIFSVTRKAEVFSRFQAVHQKGKYSHSFTGMLISP